MGEALRVILLVALAAAALTTGYRVVITMPLQMQRDAAMAA